MILKDTDTSQIQLWNGDGVMRCASPKILLSLARHIKSVFSVFDRRTNPYLFLNENTQTMRNFNI